MAILVREVLPLLIVAAVAFLLWREWRRSRRRRMAPWRMETHSVPEGGFAVELRRDGEAPQLVERIPAGLPHEEFSERLAEAQAKAEADAAALNAAQRRIRS